MQTEGLLFLNIYNLANFEHRKVTSQMANLTLLFKITKAQNSKKATRIWF